MFGQWPKAQVPGVTDTPRRTWPDPAGWTVWKLSPDGATLRERAFMNYCS